MFYLPSILRWRRSAPRWCPLREIPSAAATELVSSRCRFSLSSLEVMCNSALTFCALVEQELPEVWRWAVYDIEDLARAEGSAPTRAAARCAAVKALAVLDRQGVINVSDRKPDLPPLETGVPA